MSSPSVGTGERGETELAGELVGVFTTFNIAVDRTELCQFKRTDLHVPGCSFSFSNFLFCSRSRMTFKPFSFGKDER